VREALRVIARALAPGLRPVRRAGAIALVVVLVGGLVGEQAREAALLHVRCEHGQLVHVAAAGASHARAHAIAPRTAGEGSHEHCTLVGTQHGAPALPVASPPVLALALPVATTPKLVAHAARATFLIAPKTSPPV
jgi:hypothetical protein